MIDTSTVNRINNFAAWARTPRGEKLASCYSAEGRYVPELLRGDERADRSMPKPDPVDVRDALTVWRAINPVEGFPKRFYLAISARFIFRLKGWQFVGYMRRHDLPVGRSDEEHDGLVYQSITAAKNAIHRADLAQRSRLGYGSARVHWDMSNGPQVRPFASNQQGSHD